jgi:serine/threonine protein kinase
MTRWQQVEAVLQAALDRPAPDRVAFLNDACAGDAELQAEAASLIDAYEEAGDFIEQPALTQDAHIILGDRSPASIRREIGPYKIIERLGGGGMGEVYLAQDARLNRPVALKILPAYFVSDEQRLRRFQTEARAASALNHPNILTIYEVGESDGVHFISTEFIDGQTVRELIETAGPSLRDTLDIATDLLVGLAAAHGAGIVHRDIKPENIMRRSDGLIKILDFGIAKLLETSASDSLNDETATPTAKAQTEIGVVMGTVGYMSPEQARGLPVDERTDIWSTGVVLYEMLAIRAPFSGATRLDTMVAILERDPEPLLQNGDSQTVLPGLQRVVNKALRKEASDRYQSAAEMIADLNAVQATTAHLPSPSGKGATATHRPRNLYAIIGLTALLFAMITGAFLYQRSRSSKNIPATQLSQAPAIPVVTTKLYTQMSAAEQLEFVDQQEQRISAMMGDRPVKLNAEALNVIKRHVDRFAIRKDAGGKPDESLRNEYARAVPYIPLIARSFAARKIPIVVGIYLPMIESGYQPCFESKMGGKGLYQFLPSTAKNYGVEPADMCDAEKMTPAAAHYIADRMAELGDDSQSMTLVLLSYNVGPDWVRDTLRQLRDAGNYERTFWTLFANRDKLSGFQAESVGYVPEFFAAAIVGENPRNFDLQQSALSTLAVEKAANGKQ